MEKLFSEFPAITTEQWKEVIIKELKGADYEKKLMWKSPEGIVIKPFYTKEDVENLDFVSVSYNEVPIHRTKKESFDWVIFEEIEVNDIEEANKQALYCLQRGAEGIEFLIGYENGDLTNLFKTQDDFDRLIKGIDLEKTPIRFTCGYNTGIILSLLEYKMKNYDLNKIKIYFDYDPIGYLTLYGRFFTNEKDTFPQALAMFNYAKENNCKIFGVNGYYFQNCGSTVVQELAFSLAIASEYLTNLSELGVDVDDIAKNITLNLGVASNYFMEIAKFRAARYLWSKLLEAYNTNINKTGIHIHAITSTWNKTAYDPYVNLLRLTTEGMAAVLGGIDSLTIKPFDSVYKTPDTFSKRLSRNIQIILKEEVHLNKVIDPAGGSYYIESLTNSIIQETWKLFMQIQEMGGYIKAFKEGKIQAMIKDIQQKRDMSIATRQEILLGTNQYPNLKEKIANNVEEKRLKNNIKVVNSEFEPIKIYRGAEAFEELRLETERMKRQPKVFLLTYGNLAMRKARANFSINFFGCAGYAIIDNPGFDTIEEGIDAALKSDADIVVICSSDEEYPSIVPQIVEKINDKKILVLAGYPKEHVDNFKNLGLKHFIHIKSNVLETLKEFNSKLKEVVNC